MCIQPLHSRAPRTLTAAAAVPARRCPPLSRLASSARRCALFLLLGTRSSRDSPTPQSSSPSLERHGPQGPSGPERQRHRQSRVTSLHEKQTLSPRRGYAFSPRGYALSPRHRSSAVWRALTSSSPFRPRCSRPKVATTRVVGRLVFNHARLFRLGDTAPFCRQVVEPRLEVHQGCMLLGRVALRGNKAANFG